MIDFLVETHQRRLNDVETHKHRYLFDSFHLKNQLTGLIGPRGVGKTTLMLQYMKEKLGASENLFYVSADQLYFATNTLLSFVDMQYQYKGVDHFFIDEIHKYPNWNQELKNIHDSFPKVKIVFSGSSSLDLVKGSYDLARRAKLFHLEGLSFREYLDFFVDLYFDPTTLEQLLSEPQVLAEHLAKIPKLKGHFHDYLYSGYYPFSITDPESFTEKLLNIVDKTIYEDIAKFYNLKTQNLIYFRKILNFLASIPPGELSINNLATNLKIDFKTTENYLQILNDVGLARLVYAPDGGSRGLQKPAKIFLNNSNLLVTLNQTLGEPISVGNLRELFFLQSLKNTKTPAFYSTIGDYQIGKHHFEIGGKNKTHRQSKGSADYLLVKDDILFPSNGVIPLYLFGFLY